MNVGQQGLDPSTAYRRVQSALAKGYLINLETKPRRTAKLKVGDPLPKDRELLPPPEVLAISDCTIAEDSEGVDQKNASPSDGLSTTPGICSEISASDGRDGVDGESGEGSETAPLLPVPPEFEEVGR